MADKPKHAGGRPTKYKEEYGERLIKFMSQGFSFELFCDEIGVCPDTINNWEKAHPEFFRSKKEASRANQKFYEDLGIKGLSGKIQGFNAATWIFTMKNRFKWVDKHDISTSVKYEPIVIELFGGGQQILDMRPKNDKALPDSRDRFELEKE